MKYVYPAAFTPEHNGCGVRFPDLENCFTSGETVVEDVKMAWDALNLKERKKAVPPASAPTAFSLEKGEFVTLIAADTEEYLQRMADNRESVPGFGADFL